MHIKENNPKLNAVNGLLPIRQQPIRRIMDDDFMTSYGFIVSAVAIRN